MAAATVGDLHDLGRTRIKRARSRHIESIMLINVIWGVQLRNNYLYPEAIMIVLIRHI